jgi:hypothetical protein
MASESEVTRKVTREKERERRLLQAGEGSRSPRRRSSNYESRASREVVCPESSCSNTAIDK